MRFSFVIGLIACASNKALSPDENGLLADSDRPAWDPDPQTIDNSSSSSTVAWSPPEDEQPTHYALTVRSEFGRLAYDGTTTEPTLTLPNLRTDTEYTIDIVACYDEDCTDTVETESMQPNRWRTEVEHWKILGLDGVDFQPLMENTQAPSLINLSLLPVEEDGWVLSTLKDEGAYKSIHISRVRDVFTDASGQDMELDITSDNSSGLADFPGILSLSSASIRSVLRDDIWTMQLFVSAELATSDRSMVGSWNSLGGFEGENLFTGDRDICEIDVITDTCGMNTCIDSDHGELTQMDCVSILRDPLTQANNRDWLLIQGQHEADDTTPPNLYLAESNGDGSWSPQMTDGTVAKPFLKDATSASVWMREDHGKLYYWDEVSGTAKIRYWDPALSGETDGLELEDLEGEDRVRNVAYKDVNGEPIISADFRIVEQSFFVHDERPLMLTTVMDANGAKHITLGVLTNP